MKKVFIILFFLPLGLFAQVIGLDSLKKAIYEIDEDTLKVKALVDLANECRYYYPDEIKLINKQALTIAENSDYSLGRGLALKGMGKFFADRREYDSAFFYYQQAELIFDNLGNKKELANVVNNFCYLCIEQGEYNKALDAGLSALAYAEDANDQQELQNAYCFIGNIYNSLGNKNKALDFLLKGLEIAIVRSDNKSEALIKSDIAVVYDEKGEYNLAIKYYNEAAEILQKLDDRHSLGIAKFNIAEVYRCKKQFLNAINQYYESYQIAAGLSDDVGTNLLLLKIGGAYIELMKSNANLDGADSLIKKLGFYDVNEMLMQSAAQLEISNSKKDLLTNLEMLVELNELKKNYESAYHLNNTLIQLKDTLAGINTTLALAEMLTRYEKQRREKQLELLEAQNLANQNNISLQKQQQILILVLGLILIIFGFSVRSRIVIINNRKEELKQKNKQLEEEKIRAERSEKFKEQFLTNVSHEIRTPMNAIMGITNILIKNPHRAQQEKYLEAINISSRHLLELINSILNLSKLESGKFEIEKVSFNIRDTFRKLELEIKPLAEKKNLYFTITIDKQVPDLLVGDESMLYKILRDMCFNSLEFTPKGGISIKCGLNAITEKIAIIGFVVKDTGIGIQKKIHHKIFNSPIREVAFDKMQYDHSGLELMIIKQLLELQGGTITLDSDTGKGATFHFEIPYEVPIELTENEIKNETEQKADVDIDSIHILLVEDNDFNVMVATEELKDAIKNARIDVAANGQEAVDKVIAGNYDIVLMDIQMPVMNGYDATRAIRVLADEKAKTPIIAMTANIMESEVNKCFEAGVNAYVSKPFNIDELVSTIKTCMNNLETNKTNTL